MDKRKHVVLHAEIEIGGVQYRHRCTVPARSWEIADHTTRDAFRALAREGLGQFLANQLPITITEEIV